MPLAAPMGRSGPFSSAGASVFSAHSLSDATGLRSLKTSETGDSASVGGRRFLSAAISRTNHDRRCTNHQQTHARCKPTGYPIRLETVRRIVILGPGCSGKSTLAVRLGEITGLRVIE